MMTCDIIRGKRRYDQFWKYFGDEEFHFGHNDISNLRKKICRQLDTMKHNVATPQFDVEESCWYVVRGCDRVAGPFELNCEAVAAASEAQLSASTPPEAVAAPSCGAANVHQAEPGASQKVAAATVASAGMGVQAQDVIDLT